MNKTLLIALLAWLPAAATLPARADELATARKAIEAHYAHFDAALARRGPYPFEGRVTLDFRLVPLDRAEMDLGQTVSSWQTQMASFETVTTARSEVLSVDLVGDTVRTVVRHVVEGTKKLEVDAYKVKYKYRQEGISHDVWVKIGTEWRLRRLTAVSGKTWMDEKLLE